MQALSGKSSWLQGARSSRYICHSCIARLTAPCVLVQVRKLSINPIICAVTSKLNSQLIVSQRHRKCYATIATEVRDINPQPEAATISSESRGDLYAELQGLQQQGGEYVEVSQIQLALQGLLQEKQPITRVAILAVSEDKGDLSTLRGAKQYIRALLADPLTLKASWETMLEDVQDDGKAIVLRYGEQLDVDYRHPLIKTISIPSIFLQRHALEIFLQSAPISTLDGGGSILPRLARGPVTTDSTPSVAFPVHQCMIYTTSLNTLLQLPRSLSSSTTRIILDRASETVEASQDDRVFSIDSVQAANAIALLRSSVEHATAFEHAWLRSGISRSTSWLRSNTSSLTTTPTLPPALTSLISSILDTTEQAAQNESTRLLASAKARCPSHAERDALLTSISAWAEESHTELERHNHSPGPVWRTLSWYKLLFFPFRIDDLPTALSQHLQSDWLVRSDRHAIFLSGRLAQLSPLSSSQPPTSPPPPTISHARQTLWQKSTPGLQRLARNLLLQTTSTSLLAGTCSCLFYYTAWPAVGVAEASCFAALGLVLSLGRFQRRWETARAQWQLNAREAGVAVLRDWQVWAEQRVRRTPADTERLLAHHTHAQHVRTQVQTRVQLCRRRLLDVDAK